MTSSRLTPPLSSWETKSIALGSHFLKSKSFVPCSALLYFALSGIAFAANTITTTLPGFYSQGSVIQGVLFNSTAGNTNLLWSISAGSLPPGLTLSSRGDWAGTPTTVGTYIFTVKCFASQDPANTTATKDFTIGIPQITTGSSLAAATAGLNYSIQFQTSDGPATGGRWTVPTGQVPGLTMDPTTGVFSGAATKAGSYPFTVAVNWGVAIATKNFNLTVNTA